MTKFKLGLDISMMCLCMEFQPNISKKGRGAPERGAHSSKIANKYGILGRKSSFYKY
jgi:hypothetical protein